MSVESYCEVAFSYSRPITERLSLGGRIKGLTGMMNMGMNFDKFEIAKGSNKWIADVKGRFEVSGIRPKVIHSIQTGDQIYDLENFGEDIDWDMDFDIPAGYGVGFDLGLTCWTKKSSAYGAASKTFEFSGFEYGSGNMDIPNFELDDIEFGVDKNKSRLKMLHASFNFGGQYTFLDNRIGLGVFYAMIMQEYRNSHNITVSANFRPLKWFHFTGCYSLMENKTNAVGIGLNICPGFINIFAATDILFGKKAEGLIPIGQSNMNLTFGLGIPVGKRGER